MGKTKKVMDICLDGVHIVCVRLDGDWNPFRVYRVSAGHRRQIAKYGDFISVVYFIRDFYMDGVDTMTMHETVSWAKERGCIW